MCVFSFCVVRDAEVNLSRAQDPDDPSTFPGADAMPSILERPAELWGKLSPRTRVEDPILSGQGNSSVIYHRLIIVERMESMSIVTVTIIATV